MEKFRYTVTKEDNENKLRIKELVRRRFDFSSRLRGRLKRAGGVLLNGEEPPGWIVPEEGDIISIVMPEETSHFAPEPIPLDIIYEDDDLFIINKQPGIVVHPTKGQPCHTVANAMTYHMLSHEPFKIRFINRLDMDTSGVLAMGKNAYAQDAFIKQMQRGNVSKKYIAVVNGIIENDAGTIDLPIGRPDPERPARSVMAGGRPSITNYKTLERFPAGKGHTLLELSLETGRTHQIRVHLSHMGHPVTGDSLYGGESVYLIERQALHASSLAFCHPVSGDPVETAAPLPDDMKSLIRKLRGTL